VTVIEKYLKELEIIIPEDEPGRISMLIESHRRQRLIIRELQENYYALPEFVRWIWRKRNATNRR